MSPARRDQLGRAVSTGPERGEGGPASGSFARVLGELFDVMDYLDLGVRVELAQCSKRDQRK